MTTTPGASLPSVQAIYEEMKSRKLCKTKNEFSADWCDMHWTYFAIVGESLSKDALLSLWNRLQETGNVDLAAQVFALLRSQIGTTPRRRRRKASETTSQS